MSTKIKIEKRDILKTFRLSYYNVKSKFRTHIEVEDGQFMISASTEFFDNADDALAAGKELLIKVYVKNDTQIENKEL